MPHLSSTICHDSEIQRLKTLLSDEERKSEKLSVDVTHWKSSAAELSKSVCVLEDQAEELRNSMDAMQAKLSKRVYALQQDIKKVKAARDKEVHELQHEIVGLKLGQGNPSVEDVIDGSSLASSPSPTARRNVKRLNNAEDSVNDASSQATGASSKLARRLGSPIKNMPFRRSSNGMGDDSSNAGLSIIRRRSSVDSADSVGWEEQLEQSALETMLSKVVSERDRLAEENEDLKLGRPVRENGDGFDDETVVSGRSAASNPGAMRGSASVTSVGAKSAKTAPHFASSLFRRNNAGPSPGSPKRKSRVTVYQLSCRECDTGVYTSYPLTVSSSSFHFALRASCFVSFNPGLQYIGKARENTLRSKVNDHYSDIWDMVQASKNEEEAKGKKSKSDAAFVNSEFAQHFARHCRMAKSEKEVLEWCTGNVKVGKQTITEETSGGDDDLIHTRTVYQLTCKGCEVSAKRNIALPYRCTLSIETQL